jgi:hypothetical protein
MMQQPHCVYAQDLERNQLAGLSYHGNFQFIPLTSNASKTCSWLMTRRSWLQQQADQDLPGWTLAFVSKRPADKNEEIVIFQRKPL